jgi:NADP-dependent 3-hydroxy acid dehydrogenase YdfG/acyl carrier protein
VPDESGAGDRAVFTVSSLTTAEEAFGAAWRVHARGTLRRRTVPSSAVNGTGTPAADTHTADPHTVELRGGATDLAALLAAAATAVTYAAQAGADSADAGTEGGAEDAVAVRADALSCADPHLAARVTATADGDVAFLAADGRVLGGATRLRALAPAAAARRPEPWRPADELLFRLEWHPAEEIGADDADDPDDRDYLLVSDADGAVAGPLAAELRSRGARVTLADPPSSAPEASTDRPYADQLGAVLTEWRRAAARPHRIVVLSTLDTPAPEDTDAATLTAYRDRAELLTIALAQALHDRQDTLGGVRICVVTRGAMPATPTQRTHDALANTVWGLGRVIALEHPEVWGGAVDLDPDLTREDAAYGTVPAALADALGVAGHEDQQALRADRTEDGTSAGELGRLVCRLVPAPVEPRELRAAPAVRGDASYLITGAFGGIGTALAHWLARQGAGRLVLTARTALPDRAGWDAPGLAKAVRERIAVVRSLEAAGAEVEVAAADVADEAAMRAVVALADAEGRPLRGVVHAAGVSRPQFVREVRPADYDAVWRPKVVGGWLLHRLTEPLEVDFFLGFSSIASSWGSQHLASYSAANAFLDGLAFHRRSLGLPALTANWGPWELASDLFGDDVIAFLKATGLRPLSAPQCLALIGALLAGPETQAIVCAADWSVYRPIMEARARRPVLALIDATARDDGDGAASTILAELAGTAPEERETLLGRYLREQLAQILRIDVAALDGPFHLLEMGLDSLMVMELVSRTRKDLRVDYPSQDFFATDANFWAEFLLRHVTEAGHLDAAPDQTPADPAGSVTPDPLTELDAA